MKIKKYFTLNTICDDVKSDIIADLLPTTICGVVAGIIAIKKGNIGIGFISIFLFVFTIIFGLILSITYWKFKSICNYLIKIKKIDKNKKVIWYNKKNCVLTEELITIYEKRKIMCFKYSDIKSVTREKDYSYSSARHELIICNIYLNIYLKNDKKVKILMNIDDNGSFTPVYGIKDIVPILTEKNNDIIVNPNLKHSLIGNIITEE